MAPKKKGAPASSSKLVRPAKKIAAKKPAKIDYYSEVEIAKRAKAKAAKRAIKKSAYHKARKAVEKEIQVEKGSKSAVILSAAGPLGDPEEYSEKLGEALTALIATGNSLDAISQMPGMPSMYRLLCWINDEAHPFSLRYTRAKKMLVALYEERVQLAATQPEQFTIITRKKGIAAAGPVDTVEERVIDNTARSLLKMQAYQWTLSHLLPRKHGRLASLGSGGKNEQLEALFQALKSGPAE